MQPIEVVFIGTLTAQQNVSQEQGYIYDKHNSTGSHISGKHAHCDHANGRQMPGVVYGCLAK